MYVIAINKSNFSTVSDKTGQKVWIQGWNAKWNARVDGGCKGAGADARVDAFTWINT